jgi:phosphosulfolactate phosphohydrolase-like enzyme
MEQMKINTLWSWELPVKINGTVMVTDILAATSNLTYFVAQKAQHILIVNRDTLREGINQYPNALVIGDIPEGLSEYFDSSNSADKVMNLDVTGKNIIYMSGNGTRVIEEVYKRNPDQVGVLSFLNMQSVKKWVFDGK